MARSRRRDAARAHGARDTRGGLVLRPAARRRALRRRRADRARAGAGTRVAIALPAGLEFAQALHACLLLGAVAVPVDLRLAPAEREPDRGRRRRARRAAARRGGRCRRASPGVGTHELDATAVVIHTSGTTSSPRPVELTYGNFMWSALGSAVALGLDRASAGCARCRCRTSAGCRSCCARRSTRRRAVVHERFEEDRVLHALASSA